MHLFTLSIGDFAEILQLIQVLLDENVAHLAEGSMVVLLTRLSIKHRGQWGGCSGRSVHSFRA